MENANDHIPTLSQTITPGLGLLSALVLAAVSCGGQDFEAGRLGAVELASGDAIQIRSMHVLTGLGELGVPSHRGVELALADYGPIKGHDVSMAAGLDSLCTEEGGRAAADTVTGDLRIVGVIGPSCSVAATAASPNPQRRRFGDGCILHYVALADLRLPRQRRFQLPPRLLPDCQQRPLRGTGGRSVRIQRTPPAQHGCHP